MHVLTTLITVWCATTTVAPALAGTRPGPRPSAAPPTSTPLRPGHTLHTLVEAAWRRAEMDIPPRRRWTRRVRASALLPEVSVGYDHRRDRGWDHRLELDAPDELDTDAATTQTLRFRATWDLGELIYSYDELRVTQTILDVQSQRARIRGEVQALFQERVAKITAWSHMAPTDPGRGALEREIEALTSALELLCGVEF